MKTSAEIPPTGDELRKVTAWSKGVDFSVSFQPFHVLFSARAEDAPTRPAVKFDGGVWSYQELDARSNALANRLRELGVTPDTPVGVSVERSPELVAALLGTLKAGGAYVPLEPTLPLERLKHMIEDASPPVVICDEAGRRALAGLAPVVLDVVSAMDGARTAVPGVEVEAEHLAYVLYTSGTTGAPKGVMIPHGALANVACSYAEHLHHFGSEPNRTFSLKASYTFDMFVAELFPPLVSGQCVAIAPTGSEREPDRLIASMLEHGVTDLWGTPTLLSMLIASGNSLAGTSLSHVYSGGEALTESVATPLRRDWGVRLWNLYGPTEMCIGQTALEMDDTVTSEIVSIGRPTPNHTVAVLDPVGDQRGPAGDGEIVIAGAGEARGYSGMPRRTALSFMPSSLPGKRGARMYCTGDVGHWGEDGCIVYRGRDDDQVQVRGVRVELGELEGHLERIPGVSRAAVCAVDPIAGRTDALVAYIVASIDIEPPKPEELRDFLERHVQSAVVPGQFVFLDVMPTSAAGKIDRHALAALAENGAGTDVGILPRDEAEEAVAAIWRKHLGRERVGIHENFFQIGGHSLSAMHVQRDLAETLGLRLSLQAFGEAATIERLANLVGTTDSGLTRIRAREGMDAPLSLEQMRLYFLQRKDPSSVAYNEPLALRLQGPVDVDALRAALASIVARHDALRSYYPPGGLEPVQRITDSMPVVLTVREVSNQAEAVTILRDRLAVPFDLESEVPWRVELIAVREDGSHIVSFVFHHITLDQWTAALLLDELAARYTEHRNDTEPATLPTSRYADYAEWQRELVSSSALADGLAFWQEEMRGSTPSLDFKFGLPSAPSRAPAGRVQFEWSTDLSRRVEDFARERGVSVFVLLATLYAGFLSRITNQRNITVGVAASTRDRPELQEIIGLLLNTLPVVFAVRTDSNASNLVEQSAARWQRMRPHQWVPLSEIVRATGAGGLPFDTLFTYVPGGRDARWFAETIAHPFDYAISPEPKVPVALLMGDGDGTIVGSLEYDAGRFSRPDLQRLAAQLERFVQACVRTPDLPLVRHDLLPAETRQRLSLDWARGEAFEPFDGPIHRLIEARVAQHPERIALAFDDGAWTYEELNRRANVVAHRLIEAGVGPDVTVGVSIPRSGDLLVALLGVMKAGGAYVALQPDLPEARLRHISSDAAIHVLVCATENDARWWEGARLVVSPAEPNRSPASDADPDIEIDPEHLAYILYTSGTTGHPKGVQMRHGAVTNLVCALERRDLFTPDSVVLWKTPFGFDVSVSELYNTLAVGGRLVLTEPGAERDPGRLLETMARHGVTTLRNVPTALQLLLEQGDHEAWAAVHTVICAGEALTTGVAEKFFERTATTSGLYNLLGATETCVDTTFWRCSPATRGEVQPVGEALGNYRMYVVDGALGLADDGVAGELCVAGAGLARGYRGMARRTAESFVPEPFGDTAGGRMYRTGDTVRWGAQRRLHYVGRVDDQLQLRGIRVELGEVEANLERLEEIAAAAVVAVGLRNGRADALVAFIVLTPGADLVPRAIRAQLAEHLADAVIPTRFVAISEMPRTASGKIDRKALPESIDDWRPSERVLPRSPTEEVIATIWSNHLEVVMVGVDDDFFEVGGHSLLVMRVLHEICDHFGVTIELGEFLDAPTVAELAILVELRLASLADADDLEALLREMEAEESSEDDGTSI